MLTTLIFAALFQSTFPATLACGGTVDAATPVLTSSSGIEAILKIHTEDDYLKAIHGCQSEYTLIVTRSGKTTTDQHSSVDGDWGRPISFRLAGFSQDQTEIFGIFAEGGKYPTVQVFAYHLKTQATDTVELNQAFPRIFSAACLASLSLLGTTEAGSVVLSSEASPKCSAKDRWSLRIPSDDEVSRAREQHRPLHLHAQSLPQRTAIVPLDSSPAATLR